MELSVANVAAVGVELAREAREIGQAIWSSGELDVQDKAEEGGAFDPTTAADIAIQRRVEDVLSRLFPDLVVVGEEDTSASSSETENGQEGGGGDGVEAYLNARLPELTRVGDGEEDGRMEEVVEDASRVRVFVDPLDGTLAFTEGLVEAVMFLFGVTLDGVPVAGVMSPIFAPQPRVVVGVSGMGVAGVDLEAREETWDHNGTTGKMAASRSAPFIRDNGTAVGVCAHHPEREFEVLPMAGCGNKFLSVIDGLTDGYVETRASLKVWDTAAPTAVLSVLGGSVGGVAYEGEDVVHRDGISAWRAELSV